jgi:hypothetical protein
VSEVWVPVPGYQGYEVSALGEVRSLPRLAGGKNGSVRQIRGHVLAPSRHRSGYLYVKLYGAQGPAMLRVHRLVAVAFLGEPASPDMHVNHLNGVKDDNRLCNLEWATCSENALHAFRVLKRTGGHTGLRGSKSPFSRPVERVDPLTGEVKRYASSVEAYREDGFHHGSVRMCCSGKYRQYRGFMWRYA